MTDNIKKQSLEYGATILLVTAILNKIIGALFKIPLSADFCLGDLGFGYFSAVYDLLTPIVLLSVAGLPVAVAKIISEYNQKQNGDALKILIYARKLFFTVGLIATLLSLLVIFLCIKLIGVKENIFCYFAVIPSFVFCCLSSAYRGYFEGITNMIPPAVSSFIESVCKLGLGFSFAFITVKITGNVVLGSAFALLGITLGTVFSCIYLHIVYKKNINKVILSDKISEDEGIIKKIIVIALPIALYTFSGNVVGLIDSITVPIQLSKLFVDNFEYYERMFDFAIKEQGISQELLPTFLYGIRSKAHTLYNIIPSLTAFIGVSAVPHIAKALSESNRKLIDEQCIKVLKVSAVISIPAGIGFIALNRQIMFLLFGDSGSSVIGGNMLIFYGISTALSGIVAVMGNILQALGKQNKALINVAVGVGFKIIFNLLLCRIPSLNIYGAVISTAICFAVIFILNVFSIFLNLDREYKIFALFLKPALASVICGLTAYFISEISDKKINTLLSIVFAVVVYAFFITILKVFSIDEIKKFPFGRHILKIFCKKNLKK